jgi:(p)ppGpp synthase/HD superfamily hydrolase
MSDVSLPRLHKAIRWAGKVHKNQDRDGDAALPYISHVLEVVSNLRFVGGVTDEDLLCVAALHDVLEMSDVPASKIESRFGERVRGLVEELTRHEPSAEDTMGMTDAQIWKLRSGILLDEIKKMSPDAQQVKLADRLSNTIGALRSKTGSKLERTLKQTEEILKIVPQKVNPGLWNAIREKVDEAAKATVTPATKRSKARAKPKARRRKPAGKRAAARA